MLYLIFILSVILCIIGFLSYLVGDKRKKEAWFADKNYIEQLKKIYQNEIENSAVKEKNRLEELNRQTNEKQKQLQQIDYQITLYEQKRDSEMQRAAEAKAATNRLLESEHERARIELQGVRELEQVKMEQEFQTKREQLQLLYEHENAELKKKYDSEKSLAESEILFIKSQLDEFRAKRAAVNEQLRREEELENEQDFHRIILKHNDKEDIHYLLSIEEKIHNKELLHKLIWTEYIQRPFNQTLKNILGNRSPRNVIYCIENINNHKKYIGKTRGEYKDRQTNHIKASLGIGTISHQNIHDALYGHWDEFMFYMLEEVEDTDKLNEREKYYINFYESDKYGYNLKAGG